MNTANTQQPLPVSGITDRIADRFIRALPATVVAAVFIFLFADERIEVRPLPTTGIRRVVSLSPAISRQIRDLGEEARIVGVTSWDDLASKKGMTVTGSLIQINMETLVSLAPDMIFSSSEDGTVQRIEKIHHLGLPYYTFPRNHNYRAIETNYRSLARMMNLEHRAEEKLKRYRHELYSIVKPSSPPVIAFFVSHDPLIPVTRVSHMHNIIEDAGGRNAFRELDLPYPVVSAEALVRTDPDIIISMAHGGANMLSKLYHKITSIRAIREKKVYYVHYDPFCAFTPADYVASVKILSGIIKKAEHHGR